MAKKSLIGLSLVVIGIAALYFWPKNCGLSGCRARRLVVGTVSGYAPFVSVNSAGEYEGFDIDFAKMLANEMGRELEIQDLGSMTSLFAALAQNQVDTLIWGISITDDRLKKVAMIRYFGDDVTSYPLIFWGQIPANIHSLSDLDGQVVCIEPGSSQQAVLDHYPKIQQLAVEKIDDALLNIQYGKAIAALVEPAIAKKFKKAYKEIQLLDIKLTDYDQVHGIGVVVDLENESLIREVNRSAAVNCEWYDR